MTDKTRKKFANAYLFSILNYGAPLMFDTNTNINIKMHNLHMVCSRFARGNYGFKESCSNICKGVGKKTSNEEFTDACAKFYQRVMFNQEPRSILDKIRMPRSRNSAKLGLKAIAKNKKFKNTCINRLPEVYDRIPDALRGIKPRLFKKKLKKIRI